jgi:calcium-dependent protein kinase
MGQACAPERGVCASILLPRGATLPIPNLSEERFANVYTVGKQLAPKVCQVKHKVTSVVYVAYRLGKELHPLRDGEEISKRIKVLQSFDHPNFCQLREAFDAGRFTVLVFTQLDGKKLLESISKSSHMSEKQVAAYILQILRALNQGASAGLHHGAICPKNFFLNSKGQLSITDLGLAGFVKALPVMTCHSVEVMEHLAPEVVAQYNEYQKLADRLKPPASRFALRGRKETAEPEFTPEEKAEIVAKFTRETITPAADVWAVGTILHQLLTGQVPFKGKDLKELAEQIVQKDYKIVKNSQISSHAKSLLMKMMKKDPSERPVLHELLADPWFGDEGEGAAPATPLDAEIVQQLGSIHAETHFKKMMMRIISSKVPGRKIKELTKAFKALDSDGDGQLTMEEFKTGIVSSGLFGKDSMDVIAAFNEIDVNHSGSISVDEFLAATIDSQQEVVEGVLFDAFKAVDEDHDGRLCLEELERVVKSLDTSLGNDHVEMMMHLLENEVDGPVTFQEFKELIFREGGRSADVKELQSEVKTGGLPACARMRRKCRQVIDARPCRTVEKPAVEDVNVEMKKQVSPTHKAKSKAKSKARPK